MSSILKRKLSEVSDKGEWIFKSLQDAPVAELHNQLTAQGVNLTSITDKPTLVKVLENIIKRSQLEVERNPSAKNIWKLVSASPPHNFFSEVVIFPFQSSIYFCGPFFPSPREKPVTVVSRMNSDITWVPIETTGKQVDPFKAFKRMPLFAVYDSKLIMAYPDFEDNKYVIDSLDLETHEWSDLSNACPPSNQPPPRDYIDGCVYEGKLITVGHSSNSVTNSNNTEGNANIDCVIHVLDLSSLTWTTRNWTGQANNCPNGSSILYQDKLISFNKDGSLIYFLNLKTFHWTCETVQNKPNEFNCRRHSHLIQVYKDQLILIRVLDNFVVNSFDLIEKKWSIIDVIGKRPTKVRTEASFTLINDTLFALGGQTGKNHFLCFNLNERQCFKKPDSVLQNMFLDDTFKDVSLKVKDDPRSIGAHKSVLSSRSQYFRAMFSGNFKETNQNEVTLIDFKFESIEKIIKHMYDSLEMKQLEHKDSHDLFQACCYLDYTPFLEELVDFVIEALTPENALETFELSNLESPYKDHIFKHTVAFISKNKAKVSEQSKFIEFCQRNPSLLKEIFGNLDNPQPPQKKIRSLEGSSTTLTNDLHVAVTEGGLEILRIS